MALGTGEHVIGGKKVNVVGAQRTPIGAGGLVQQGLTVRLGRGGGYNYKGPTLRRPSAGAIKTTTLIRRPRLKIQAPARKIQRVSAQPRRTPAIARQPRVIIPTTGGLLTR